MEHHEILELGNKAFEIQVAMVEEISNIGSGARMRFGELGIDKKYIEILIVDALASALAGRISCLIKEDIVDVGRLREIVNEQLDKGYNEGVKSTVQ